MPISRTNGDEPDQAEPGEDLEVVVVRLAHQDRAVGREPAREVGAEAEAEDERARVRIDARSIVSENHSVRWLRLPSPTPVPPMSVEELLAQERRARAAEPAGRLDGEDDRGRHEQRARPLP